MKCAVFARMHRCTKSTTRQTINSIWDSHRFSSFFDTFRLDLFTSLFHIRNKGETVQPTFDDISVYKKLHR